MIFLLLSFSIVSAGWPIPKGCPLEWYEKNEYCPSFYNIWKVIRWINNIKITNEEYDKYWCLDSSVEKNYILWNNYFYTENWLQHIKESLLVWEWWVYMWKINKWDVIIIDNNIYNYEDKKEEEIAKKSTEFLKKKIWFNGKLFITPSYGNYYKVTCKNSIISLSNEAKEYNLWYQHGWVFDKKIWNKEKLRNNLQKYIKTCDNFNKMFNIKKYNKENKQVTKNNIAIKKQSWFGKIMDFIKWILLWKF